MFAVIKTGGKQYRVESGKFVTVEKIDGEPGTPVTLGEVLLVGDAAATKVGSPTVKGAAVTAEIARQFRNDKVLVFKKKRRHNYRRKRGHRQDLTTLKITGITAGA